jgi:hypothetical protein
VVLGAVLMIGLVAAVKQFAGAILPQEELESVSIGTTHDEVKRRLGPPSEVTNHGDWIYTKWGNPGWVEIGFDESGRVRKVNDESPFP